MISLLKHKIKLALNIPSRQGGLIPSPPDERDWQYEPAGSSTIQELVEIDLSPELPPVKNQGQANSCVYFAWSCVFENHLIRFHDVDVKNYFNFSEHYPWFWHRTIEGNRNRNVGVIARNAPNIMKTYGFTTEEYYSNNLSWRAAPNQAAMVTADIYNKFLMPKLGGYYNVFQLDIPSALAEGRLVTVGMLMNKQSFGLNISNPYWTDLSNPEFAHFMTIVGLVERDGEWWYKVRNSWGFFWGERGYCYVRKSVLEMNSFDTWTIQ